MICNALCKSLNHQFTTTLKNFSICIATYDVCTTISTIKFHYTDADPWDSRNWKSMFKHGIKRIHRLRDLIFAKNYIRITTIVKWNYYYISDSRELETGCAYHLLRSDSKPQESNCYSVRWLQKENIFSKVFIHFGIRPIVSPVENSLYSG